MLYARCANLRSNSVSAAGSIIFHQSSRFSAEAPKMNPLPPLHTAQLRAYKLLRSVLALALMFAAGFGAYHAVFGSGAEAEHAGQAGDATVRISARHLEGGGVQVALQERDNQSQWGQRHTPRADVLPADAPVGAWRHSSELSVGTFWPESGALPGTETLFDAPRLPIEDGLACVIGHGDPAEDLFWEVTANAVSNSSYLNRVSTRIVMTDDAAEQSAAIRACTADGAFAIAATLANFEAVGEALLEAGAAGVEVYTYNSGADQARDVNSILHVSLDERAGGRLAGQRMNDAGVSGVVYCLIHEEVNIGLEERCEGLEATYEGGAVERVRIHNEAGRASAAEALTDESVAAVLALNGNTAVWAVEQGAAAGRSDLYIASFGVNLNVLLHLMTGQARFAIWDQPTLQGIFIANALRTRHLVSTPPLLQVGGAKVSIEPVLFDRQRLISMLRELPPDSLAALLARAGISPAQIEQLMRSLGG